MNARLVTLLPLFLVAACLPAAGDGPTPSGGPSAPASPPSSSPVTPTPSGAIDHPTGSRELVLRIETSGGLAGPGLPPGQIPQVSVYGDGRIITEGPQIEIYPSPALPSIQVTRVSMPGLQLLLAGADDAGLLGRDGRLDLPGIFDAGTTTFTVNAAGGRHVVSAYALGLEGGLEDRIPPDELDQRRRLSAFAAALHDLSWLRPEIIAEGIPYAFDDIRIFVVPAALSEEPGLPAAILDWPLEQPLSELGDPYPMGEGARCGTVSGDDLESLLPLLQAANAETRWASGDDLYRLLLRPLLPDESGCASP